MRSGLVRSGMTNIIVIREDMCRWGLFLGLYVYGGRLVVGFLFGCWRFTVFVEDMIPLAILIC